MNFYRKQFPTDQNNGIHFIVIELYHVNKRYAGSEQASLSDINLKIEKGEFCFVTGPSGAGKSTLLKLLFGAEKASGGQVRFQGQDISRMNQHQIAQLRRKIGVVFQDFKLLLEHTVQDNVALTLEVQGRKRSEINKRCFEILQLVGLAHKSNQHVSTLSGGEQQRVAIARALVTDPVLLLADEPTGNLDPERSQDIMNFLLKANARGTTILVATHDPSFMERYKRRLLHIDAGKLVQDEKW